MFLSWNDGEVKKLKFKAGRVLCPVYIERKRNRLWFQFGYSPDVSDNIKLRCRGYKWHNYEDPPIKQWSVEYNQRNLFQIAYMAGQNPYAQYDKDVVPYEKIGEPNEIGAYRYKIDGRVTRFHLFEAQAHMTAHFLTRRYGIVAGDMGTGKTLATFTALNHLRANNVLWVGTSSSIASTELEYRKWGVTWQIHYCNYRGLPKLWNDWPTDTPMYKFIVFDEASRLKNGTTKQATAAQYLTDTQRDQYGWDGFAAELSGTPAPKAPTDWHSLTEIAMPGWLKEAHVAKLKEELAIIEQRPGAAGGVYPHLVTWMDDKNKCRVCGEYEGFCEEHDFEAIGENRVLKLNARNRGMVLVKLKKHCLDLPDKHYRLVNCPPTKKTLRMMAMIKKTSPSAIKALTALRQLSDGFMYSDKEVGTRKCDLCAGLKTIVEPAYIGPDKTEEFVKSLDPLAISDNWDLYPLDPVKYPHLYEIQDVACPECSGTGTIKQYQRETNIFNSPKVKALKEILVDHEEIGRLVVFGGYTGSVDLLTELIDKLEMWHYIRMDGRGWSTSIPGIDKPTEMLDYFQSGEGRVVFIGQPSAAGMGITLTASPTIVYYSNDFNGESRMQSEDRIHRIGMDTNLGATIIDLIHLPSDTYILNNLKKKRKLQNLTLGELEFDDKDILIQR